MQGARGAHISPAEWRWVIIFGGILAALTLLPYAWALSANAANPDWQFMGILANPQDGATYLAKIEQGIRGSWLVKFAHTPEAHRGAGIVVFYPFLGHIARLIGVSNVVMFHLARVITTLFMFTAIYMLGAAIWTRQRPRRLFFMLAAVGSGLGWLVLVLDPTLTDVPDLVVPEAYPLYAAFTNPHFPLAIALLTLIAAVYVDTFRIGLQEEPTIHNGGLLVLVLVFLLALVLPQALVPLGAALVMYVVVIGMRHRKIPALELRWVAMYILPAALMAGYYYAVVTYNPIIQAWNRQITTPTASPWLVLAAYGGLLLVGLPGLVRAVRRLEEDSDQLMLIWLVVNLGLVFFPFNHQRRFMLGLILPVVFFAVRSLEDYWLVRIPRRLHSVAIVLLVVLVIPSNVLAMGIPLFGLLNPEAGVEQRLLVERGYGDALDWLRAHGNSEEVVLTGPNLGLWVPPYANKRVVYGHPYETINAASRLSQVQDWFTGTNCYVPSDALDGYHISYVLVGPQERAYEGADQSDPTCLGSLPPVSEILEFDDVRVYVLGQ